MTGATTLRNHIEVAVSLADRLAIFHDEGAVICAELHAAIELLDEAPKTFGKFEGRLVLDPDPIRQEAE